jgi:hypothetical protein
MTREVTHTSATPRMSMATTLTTAKYRVRGQRRRAVASGDLASSQGRDRSRVRAVWGRD